MGWKGLISSFGRHLFLMGPKERYYDKEDLPNVSRDGLMVTAMLADYDRSRLPVCTDTIKSAGWIGNKIVAECGHPSFEKLMFNAYGIPLTSPGEKRCKDCSIKQLEEMTLRCPLCGLPIFPGDEVSICDTGSETQYGLEKTFILEDESFLACNRNDCALPGFFCGYWYGPNIGFQPLPEAQPSGDA